MKKNHKCQMAIQSYINFTKYTLLKFKGKTIKPCRVDRRICKSFFIWKGTVSDVVC